MSTDPRRTVLFTTGIRSEYDILYSVMRAVDAHPSLRTQVIITGAHLAAQYGNTVAEVERDGFECVAKIESLLNSDSKAGRVKSAAIQLGSLVDVFTNVRPDFVVAMADREEALTVATAGAYLSIPVVHIGGGDTAQDGNIDNAVRDAVTKLSHLHMVTTTRSGERVRRLGEEEWRVHVVGAPGLDRLVTTPALPLREVGAAVGAELQPLGYSVVIQHSIIDSADGAGDQMRITLDALLALGLPIIVGYPNSDAGGQRIIEMIDAYAAAYPVRIRAYRNLSRALFVNLIRSAAVLVGNSSAGIIEAPLLGLPVVNIGARQVGRECAANVIFVGHNQDEIIAAVRRATLDADFRRGLETLVNPYGDGSAGSRIAEIVASTAITPGLVYKRSTF